MYSYTRPPSGVSPCEAFGTIDKTGQEFSFRHRSGMASIRIASKHPINERNYNKKVSAPAASLPVIAEDLIAHWISMQLREQDIARVIFALWQNCLNSASSVVELSSSIASFKANESGNIVSGAFKADSGFAVFQLSTDSLSRLLCENDDFNGIGTEEISVSRQEDTTFFRSVGRDWTVNFTFIASE